MEALMPIILKWISLGEQALPHILALVSGVREILAKGGTSAEELRAAIDAARARHASADVANALAEELRLLHLDE
jgi:hypothetical protein